MRKCYYTFGRIYRLAAYHSGIFGLVAVLTYFSIRICILLLGSERSRGDLPLQEIPPIDPHDLKHEHIHDATPPLFKIVICYQHLKNSVLKCSVVQW